MLGITGTGGSGKSSLTDELLRRFRLDQEDKLRIAVLAVDPTRRRGGGALLGDRIRMNYASGRRRRAVFFRSLATRGARGRLPEHLADDDRRAARPPASTWSSSRRRASARATPAIVPLVDVSLYVMTPEFGAASQLEKIDMLDFADVVAINKFERRGAEDALRDVGRQLVRNREAFGAAWQDMPVFGTSAARFNDDGVTALYQHLRDLLAADGLPVGEGRLARRAGKTSTAPATRCCRRTGCATWPRSPRPSAATTRRDAGAGGARAAAPAPADGARRSSATAVGARRLRRGGARAAVREPRRCSTRGRGPSSSTRATSWSSRSAAASCARR